MNVYAYPPVPPICDSQSDRPDTDNPCQPATPTTITTTVSEPAPTPVDNTLPVTGGPGTTVILLVAGLAVAAGVAVTGIAARRREDAEVTL